MTGNDPDHPSPPPAGRIFVDHYASTSLPLLLPAMEDGVTASSWRIRQSSVTLLGKLLFKVCHAAHAYALPPLYTACLCTCLLPLS